MSADRTRAWETMLVQAQRFADVGTLGEAAARAKQVANEVERALGPTRGAAEREALERLARRAARQADYWSEQDAANQAKIEAHRWSKVENADEEFARPLPKAPHEL